MRCAGDFSAGLIPFCLSIFSLACSRLNCFLDRDPMVFAEKTGIYKDCGENGLEAFCSAGEHLSAKCPAKKLVKKIHFSGLQRDAQVMDGCILYLPAQGKVVILYDKAHIAVILPLCADDVAAELRIIGCL